MREIFPGFGLSDGPSDGMFFSRSTDFGSAPGFGNPRCLDSHGTRFPWDTENDGPQNPLFELSKPRSRCFSTFLWATHGKKALTSSSSMSLLGCWRVKKKDRAAWYLKIPRYSWSEDSPTKKPDFIEYTVYINVYNYIIIYTVICIALHIFVFTAS